MESGDENKTHPFKCFQHIVPWFWPMQKRIEQQGEHSGFSDSQDTVYIDETVRATFDLTVEEPAVEEHANSHVFEIDPGFLSINGSKVIGRGGSAIVYEGSLLCEGISLPVAVKRLTVVSTEEEQHMIRDELKVLSVATALCTRTCRLMGVCTQSGRLCIVTRLYKCSLANLLSSQPGRRLTVHRTLELATELSAALVELHRAHIVHQDLKPSNLLLDDADNLVIADFGISQCLSTICTRCLPSQAAGTPHFMAPEAFDPAEFGGITAAADIWSMGCCVLQMLQGKPPWDGMRSQQISRQVCDKRSTPSMEADIPPPLAKLLFDCFSSPVERPTAVQVHARLVEMKSQLLVSERAVEEVLSACLARRKEMQGSTCAAATTATPCRSDPPTCCFNDSAPADSPKSNDSGGGSSQLTLLRGAEQIQEQSLPKDDILEAVKMSLQQQVDSLLEQKAAAEQAVNAAEAKAAAAEARVAAAEVSGRLW
eukprot:CAMPEP_0119316040 /NCGR_PEP_ID=MMETSP1333-20130426/38255_1 /TAXON_ID=418940 /ORGANISM="Scyphosphaera apsteinii, Strain RCC1455" /LENGTH=482 /DNA_ID=CAMNT_0007321575 /DNA_START=11 /DNA_END=1456 /DNA_ORIENTATION=+